MIQKGVKILEGQHDHTWGYRLRHDNKHNLIIEMIDDKSFLSIYLLYAISYNWNVVFTYSLVIENIIFSAFTKL